MKVPYEETTFFGLLKIVTIRTFLNWSFFWALFLTLWIFLFVWKNDNLFGSAKIISKELSPLLLGASAGILGIVLAALSVTVALFHKALLPKMLENKLLHEYLFPFWKAVVLWAISIVICFFLIIFNALELYCYTIYLTYIEIFIFLYATFYTVKLTGVVIQLAIQKASILDNK